MPTLLENDSEQQALRVPQAPASEIAVVLEADTEPESRKCFNQKSLRIPNDICFTGVLFELRMTRTNEASSD